MLPTIVQLYVRCVYSIQTRRKSKQWKKNNKQKLYIDVRGIAFQKKLQVKEKKKRQVVPVRVKGMKKKKSYRNTYTYYSYVNETQFE